VLFNKDKTSLLVFPSGKSGRYVIPNTVTNIAWEAFADNKLIAIFIPNSVTNIGLNSFSGKVFSFAETAPSIFSTSNINNVYIPLSSTGYETWLSSLRGFFFEKDGLLYGLYSVANSSEKFVSVLGTMMDSIKQVIIPKTVNHNGDTYTVGFIEQYAFDGCINLQSITLPYVNRSASRYLGALFHY